MSRHRTRTRLAVEALEPRLAPSTYTVTSTADDGSSGTFRWAVTQANSDPGSTVAFNIPGGGVHAIQLLDNNNDLIISADGTVIDGFTQPGAHAATKADVSDPVIQIELDGSALVHPSSISGLHVAASNCVIQGLDIHSFPGDGIAFGGAATRNNTVQQCFLGTDPGGTQALGDGYCGIEFAGGKDTSNTVTQCVIAGSGFDGILVSSSDAQNNIIQGDWIGTDVTGTINLANTHDGVEVNSGSGTAQGTIIGGPGIGQGDIVANNGSAGVEVAAARPLAAIGNTIDPDSIFGNGGPGILLTGYGNDGIAAPVLTGALLQPDGGVLVSGAVTGAPGTYRVELFSSPRPDEGRAFQGAVNVAVGPSGQGTFAADLPRPPFAFLTATATDSLGDTSEFSTALTPQAPPAPATPGGPTQIQTPGEAAPAPSLLDVTRLFHVHVRRRRFWHREQFTVRLTLHRHLVLSGPLLLETALLSTSPVPRLLLATGRQLHGGHVLHAVASHPLAETDGAVLVVRVLEG